MGDEIIAKYWQDCLVKSIARWCPKFIFAFLCDLASLREPASFASSNSRKGAKPAKNSQRKPLGHYPQVVAAGQSDWSGVNFSAILNSCGFAIESALLRFRRPSLSSGISKRSEGKDRHGFSDARQRHGVTPDTNRALESAYQRTHRAFQDT